MLNASRRGLLGMFAAGVAASIVRSGIVMPIKPGLAISSRNFTNDEMSFLEGMSQTIAQTIVYDDDGVHPREYTGFEPFYSGRSIIMEFPKGTNEGFRLVKL